MSLTIAYNASSLPADRAPTLSAPDAAALEDARYAVAVSRLERWIANGTGTTYEVLACDTDALRTRFTTDHTAQLQAAGYSVDIGTSSIGDTVIIVSVPEPPPGPV